MKLVGPNDPALRQAANPVDFDFEWDDPWRANLVDMIADLYQLIDDMPGAAAVAAPQVGIPVRLFVYSFDGMRGYMVNPTIITHSPQARLVTEGCLTYPGRLWKVRRFVRCQVLSYDHFGVRRVRDFAYFPAQVMQHEIDHLDGILLPDHAVREVVKS